jgi:hypothetical protein
MQVDRKAARENRIDGRCQVLPQLADSPGCSKSQQGNPKKLTLRARRFGDLFSGLTRGCPLAGRR